MNLQCFVSYFRIHHQPPKKEKAKVGNLSREFIEQKGKLYRFFLRLLCTRRSSLLEKKRSEKEDNTENRLTWCINNKNTTERSNLMESSNWSATNHHSCPFRFVSFVSSRVDFHIFRASCDKRVAHEHPTSSLINFNGNNLLNRP